MSNENIFPRLVYPARSVYHSVYGSHDATTPEKAASPWKYWVSCRGGPKRKGWPVSMSISELVMWESAEERGLRPCQSRECQFTLNRLRAVTEDTDA
jgi:hypothetical protein